MKSISTEPIISIKINNQLNLMLEKFAKKYDRSKSYILRKALENYIEDQIDLERGLKALLEHENGNQKIISLEKIIDKYGLAN